MVSKSAPPAFYPEWILNFWAELSNLQTQASNSKRHRQRVQAWNIKQSMK